MMDLQIGRSKKNHYLVNLLAHTVFLISFSSGVATAVWADNPYAAVVDSSNSSTDTSDPLLMMQSGTNTPASPRLDPSDQDKKQGNKNFNQQQEGPVYQVKTINAPVPAAASPHYVQAAPLLQPAANIKDGASAGTSQVQPGSASAPALSKPGRSQLKSKQPVESLPQPASASGFQSIGLSQAVAKKFVTHDSGFSVISPILIDAPMQNEKAINYEKYNENFAKNTSDMISHAMLPVKSALRNKILFSSSENGQSVESGLNEAVLGPFQNRAWMSNLQEASSEQVLKELAVQLALQNYLLNQILATESQQVLLQTAQVRSNYDLIYYMESQEKANAERQSELLKAIRNLAEQQQQKQGRK